MKAERLKPHAGAPAMRKPSRLFGQGILMTHSRPRSGALLLAVFFLVVAGAVPAQAGRRGGGGHAGGGHAGGGHHAGVAHHGGGFASHAAPFYTGGRYTGF